MWARVAHFIQILSPSLPGNRFYRNSQFQQASYRLVVVVLGFCLFVLFFVVSVFAGAYWFGGFPESHFLGVFASCEFFCYSVPLLSTSVVNLFPQLPSDVVLLTF